VGPLGGWFQGILQNVHLGADDIASAIDPYNPGDDARAPYPVIVPRGWDIWLLGVGAVQTALTGVLANAVFQINPTGTEVGWARDNSGNPVAGGSPSFSVARFDSILGGTGAISQDPFLTPDGQTFVRVGIRIARGSALEFHTTSAGATTYQGLFLMGLFPEGLGQDVLNL